MVVFPLAQRAHRFAPASLVAVGRLAQSMEKRRVCDAGAASL